MMKVHSFNVTNSTDPRKNHKNPTTKPIVFKYPTKKPIYKYPSHKPFNVIPKKPSSVLVKTSKPIYKYPTKKPVVTKTISPTALKAGNAFLTTQTLGNVNVNSLNTTDGILALKRTILLSLNDASLTIDQIAIISIIGKQEAINMVKISYKVFFDPITPAATYNKLTTSLANAINSGYFIDTLKTEAKQLNAPNMNNVINVSSNIDPLETASPPTLAPTNQHTKTPTFQSSVIPTCVPSYKPTQTPTFQPLVIPTFVPSYKPTVVPSIKPSVKITSIPSTFMPTDMPTKVPSFVPSDSPFSSFEPSASPTLVPSHEPSTFGCLLPCLNVGTCSCTLFKTSGIGSDVVLCNQNIANEYFGVYDAAEYPLFGTNLMLSNPSFPGTSALANCNGVTYDNQQPLTSNGVGYTVGSTNYSISYGMPNGYRVTQCGNSGGIYNAHNGGPVTCPSTSPTIMPSIAPSVEPSIEPTPFVSACFCEKYELSSSFQSITACYNNSKPDMYFGVYLDNDPTFSNNVIIPNPIFPDPTFASGCFYTNNKHPLDTIGLGIIYLNHNINLYVGGSSNYVIDTCTGATLTLTSMIPVSCPSTLLNNANANIQLISETELTNDSKIATGVIVTVVIISIFCMAVIFVLYRKYKSNIVREDKKNNGLESFYTTSDEYSYYSNNPAHEIQSFGQYHVNNNEGNNTVSETSSNIGDDK